jgi:hypothetical protein
MLLATAWAGLVRSAEPPATAADNSAPPTKQPDEVPIFDGKSLEGWRVIDTFDFRRHGKVYVKDGTIFLEQGEPATGISWKGQIPRTNYEITLDGQRVAGSDFFCGLTFPVKEEYCTLILGGWGGSVVGLSNVDGYAAVENETTQAVDFQPKRWYAIRLRVTDQRITVWIDDDKLIDLEIRDKKFSIYWEQDPVKPLGLVTWQTSGALKNLKLKRIAP